MEFKEFTENLGALAGTRYLGPGYGTDIGRRFGRYLGDKIEDKVRTLLAKRKA